MSGNHTQSVRVQTSLIGFATRHAAATDMGQHLAAPTVDRRTIRPIAEIESLMRTVIEGCAKCAGDASVTVYWQAPDASGCNWSVFPLHGSESCLACIEQAASRLQQVYNVPGR